MRPTCGVRVLPPALMPLTIVLAAARARISCWGVRIALEIKAEEVVASDVRDRGIGRRLARYKAALGLIAQHRDKLGAVVGLAAQRLVRDDDRGSRQCGRRDALEHLLRNDDAVERGLGVVRVVDR